MGERPIGQRHAADRAAGAEAAAPCDNGAVPQLALQGGQRAEGLSLGDPAFVALKNFLRRQARPCHNQNLAKTYGAFRSDEPLV
jgi:hypothetical protein